MLQHCRAWKCCKHYWWLDICQFAQGCYCYTAGPIRFATRCCAPGRIHRFLVIQLKPKHKGQNVPGGTDEGMKQP